ncbi:MAG TPA: SpoIIE family protein phosphatase [Acidimicrobiales bacterium]|jgi:PAS domain S-box-containing protein
MSEAATPTPAGAVTPLLGLEAQLLERIDAAVIAVDLEGRILFANRGVESLYGWSPDELIGCSSAELSGVAVGSELAAEIVRTLEQGLSWEGNFEVQNKDGSVVSVHAIDSPLYSASGELVGVLSIGIDVRHERLGEPARVGHTQQVEHFLNECSMVLASSLDYERNFVTLAEFAVPFLADVCLIDIADDEGGIRRMAAVHSDPATQHLLDEIKTMYAPDPLGNHPAVGVLRDGEPFVSGDITDEFLPTVTRDERHYQIVAELGFSSFISVPLSARGRVQGALTLISCSPGRRFGDRDVAIAIELAKQAAIAIDNARLFDDQQRARAEAEALADRLGQLQRLSAALARAVSVTEVAQVIRDVSMGGIDPPSRGVWLLDEMSGELRLIPGSDQGTVEPQFESICLDAPLPAAQVVRTGTPVFMHSLEERDRSFPTFANTRGTGLSFAVLPLHAQQRVIGALALGFRDERSFDDDEARFLIAVAEQCAQALSRALLYDRERLGRDRAETDRRRIQELNRALQTSLLPPSLPDIPGVELSARYHPALAGLEVGGDFYDVFDTGGDWAVVVGDVCGKGPEAAAVTATARWTIRSVAMDMRQPAQVLRKLNEAMVHQQLDDRFCTLTYTRVVPTAQGVRLSVCRGGHPAPLVLRANGDVEPIGTAGTLIGVLPDVRLWEETTQLQPGDAFVAYTDGVTEARRDREQFGDERLQATLARCAGLDAAAIGEAIEAAVLAFGGAEPSDDLAILVLRVPPT